MTSNEKEKVVSLAGSPIYHYDEPEPFKAPDGEMCLEEISAHIEAHLGKVGTVYHEIVSDTVHIDVHLVPPDDDNPYARLVTSGMSDLPMTIPDDIDAPRHVELIISLPPAWQLDQASFNDERWYWPVRLIKQLARFPHKHKTWLGWGHTMPNGDPAQPYAPDTKLSGVILLPPVSVSDEFRTLAIDAEKVIAFYSVVPLYPEEMELKLRKGSDALLEAFDKKGISDVVHSNRPNAAKRRFGLF